MERRDHLRNLPAFFRRAAGIAIALLAACIVILFSSCTGIINPGDTTPVSEPTGETQPSGSTDISQSSESSDTSQPTQSTEPTGPDIGMMKSVLSSPVFYSGISVNGMDLSGKTRREAEELLASAAGAGAPPVSYVLSVQGVDYPLDATLLGFSSNLEEVLDEAWNYLRPSEISTDDNEIISQYSAVLELAASPKDFSLSYSIDPDQVYDTVFSVVAPLTIMPKDATVTGFDTGIPGFTIQDSVRGVFFDVNAAVKELADVSAAKEFSKVITMPAYYIEPSVTKDFLAGYLGLVSTTATQTTDIDNRNHNISLVCKSIDGLVLWPGETFDFNKVVGPRTAARGYRTAGAIVNGVLIQAVGGGICQPNGTLFNSVMKADLQIDERHPHSWPSDYLPIGTDATISGSSKNFRFTNNTDYPIAIHCWYKDLTVTFEIYGRPVADGMKIAIKGIVLYSNPPGPTEYVADASLAVGRSYTIRKPHNEIGAQCWKVYFKDGVEIRRELAFKSYYRPITKKVAVGVLMPDGTVGSVNPSTGEVILPAPTPAV